MSVLITAFSASGNGGCGVKENASKYHLLKLKTTDNWEGVECKDSMLISIALTIDMSNTDIQFLSQ